ncbi:MAG: hypothetical protein WEE50_11510 [Chloroflexota bacterium]
MISIVIIAAIIAVAAALATSAGVSTQNPASVTSNWLVDPEYLDFRRAETGQRSTGSTSYPPRPVIVPRNVTHVGNGDQ